MSILFVLLTYIIVITVNYMVFRAPRALPISPAMSVRPPAPAMTKEHGFSIPKGYCFHPGHTWVMREGQKMLASDWMHSPPMWSERLTASRCSIPIGGFVRDNA